MGRREGLRILGAVAALLFPWVAGDYARFLAVEVLALALFAVSYNLLLGYGGMLSLGHAAPFGIGAYTVALLALRGGQSSVLVALPAAVAAAMLAALLTGLFVVRSSQVFFTMLTLAFAQMFYALASRWYAVTGGDTGLPGLPPPSLGPWTLSSGTALYYLALLLAGGGLWALWRLVRSPFGLTLRATRENPRRSAFLGVRVARVRLATYVVAWGWAAVAGALWAWNQRAAFPDTLYWSRSAEVMAMTILGGQGSFFGPVLGAALITVLEPLLNRLWEYWSLSLGLVVILVVFLLPQGLLGGRAERRRGRSGDVRGEGAGQRAGSGARSA